MGPNLLRRRAPTKSRFLTQISKVLKSSVVSSKAVNSEVEGSMDSSWCAGPDEISTSLLINDFSFRFILGQSPLSFGSDFLEIST